LSFRFCEEDIEQILERRTQVITVDSVGQGSTFAKVGIMTSNATSRAISNDENINENLNM
jgi:hypothetical protein